MSRFHVDTRAQLILVQVALDRAFGLRDAAGNPTPRERTIVKGGVTGTAFAMGCPQELDLPGTHWPMIEGADGTAAIQIAEDAPITAKLGRDGIPSAASLVQVTRPRDHSRLPAGVRDKLDDAYIDSVLDGADDVGVPRDTPGARAAIATELQGRAAAALARKDARGALVMVDRMFGGT